MAERRRKIPALRKAVQAMTGLAQNGHLAGFVTGRIYTGPLKRFCVPGMNCYSCPGALGACPIGALQAVLGSRKARFPFYVLGWLAMLGVLAGRFICGWLCLFGLVQELVYKIPVRKWKVPERADRILRYGKYLVLVFLVVLFPAFLRNRFGISTPWFCKVLCPVGMLEGGIPLLILNKALRPAASFLYAWKGLVLLLVLFLSAKVHRPFCKYICPLGAFYGLFAKISIIRLRLDTGACTGCGACRGVCPMQVDPSRTPDSAECIRCGACMSACRQSALSFGTVFGNGKEKHGRKETA